jgi:lysophospholipase L1-like esterase
VARGLVSPGVTSLLVANAATGVTAGCDLCIISGLGINDAGGGGLSASIYKANLAGICAYVLANGYSKVILDYPTCPVSAPSRIAAILTYLPKINELVNGTTILLGDIWSFDMTMVFHDLFLQDDGIHPNAVGTVRVGLNHAIGFAKAMGDLSSGGGGLLVGGGMSGGFQKE